MPLRYFTDTGIEVPAVTTEQMIEVDRVAVEDTGPNLLQMMENAGRNLAQQAIVSLGETWREANIVVLAGNGGNGGGGICGARHLANRGAQVRLCLVSPDRLGAAGRWQRHIYQAIPGREVDIQSLIGSNEPVDVILDALIGYSLREAPRGNALRLIQWANGADTPILALDIPSGVNATNGETPDEYIKARWTLTLALPKTGLLPDHTGDLILADIGIPPAAYAWETLKLPYTPPFGDRFLVPLTITSM
jgi:NAD(P)H-hydrate epimerase